MLRIVVSVVALALATSAAAAEYVTPAAGGPGGVTFSTACPTDKVLVGIRGKHGTYIDRLEGICVRVNSNGTWNGQPTYDGGATGGYGGADYEARCPTNHAVSAIAGKASNWVDQLKIMCHPMGTDGRFTGAGAFVKNASNQDMIIGGSLAGTAFGPGAYADPGADGGYFCRNQKPGRGFRGASYSWLDKISLVCDYPAVGPALLGPDPNGDVPDPTAGVTFNWGTSNDVTKYQLCLTRLTSASCSPSIGTTLVYDNLTTSKTVSASDLAPFHGRPLLWKVNAVNANGTRSSCDRDIQGNCVGGRSLWVRHPNATLTGPDTAANTKPTFQWTTASNADGYKFRYYRMSDASGAANDTDIFSGSTGSYTPSADLPGGEIFWMVHVCKRKTACTPTATNPCAFDLNVHCGSGGVQGTASRKLTIPGTDALEWKWTTVLTAAHFTNIGHTLSPDQVTRLSQQQHTLQKIITSQTDRLFDTKRCNECHNITTTNTQFAATYHPKAPLENKYALHKKNTSSTTTYRWDDPTAAGTVPAFKSNVNAGKPQILKDLFQKWIDAGAQ